jgi:hypothetical protein
MRLRPARPMRGAAGLSSPPRAAPMQAYPQRQGAFVEPPP